MKLITLRRVSQPRNSLAGFSLIGVLIALSFLTTTAQGQTATYSDSFVIDNSGVYYDPEVDEFVFPESPGSPALIIGVGVTEADYDSYSDSITTTLTGPNGLYASGMSSDTPSGRVEITMEPADDENDYDYSVQTVHRYYQDPLILAAGPKCVSDRPCIQEAAYRGSRPLNFFEVFTEATVTVRVSHTSFEYQNHYRIPPPFTAKLCYMRKMCRAAVQTIFGCNSLCFIVALHILG